jgi:DNA-binding transcriptional regulator YiaG
VEGGLCFGARLGVIDNTLLGMEVKKRTLPGQFIIEKFAKTPARTKSGQRSSGEVANVDVKAIRTKLGLSQAQFAAKFGFSLGGIRNWEAGGSRPYGAARLLLAVIAEHPEAVDRALASLKRGDLHSDA